jgi:hypothetical protein
MNKNSILLYLALFTLSFNVFAVEVMENPKLILVDQAPLTVKVAYIQESLPGILSTAHIVKSHTITQTPVEEPSEFVTALGVYLLIIGFYSIYGFISQPKKTPLVENNLSNLNLMDR